MSLSWFAALCRRSTRARARRNATNLATTVERAESFCSISSQWGQAFAAAIPAVAANVQADVHMAEQLAFATLNGDPSLHSDLSSGTVSSGSLSSFDGVQTHTRDTLSTSALGSNSGSSGATSTAASESTDNSHSVPQLLNPALSPSITSNLTDALFSKPLFAPFDDPSTNRPSRGESSLRSLSRATPDDSSVGRGTGSSAGASNNDGGGPASSVASVAAGNLGGAVPFPSPSSTTNGGGGAGGIEASYTASAREHNRPENGAVAPRSATSLGVDEDIAPTEFVRFVAKSFINGVNPIGSIVPDWSPGLTDPIPIPGTSLFPLVGPTPTSATARLTILAGAVGGLAAFNEDPQTDAMNHIMYRLFTRVETSFNCDGDNIYNFSMLSAMDGGNELPLIDGTIEMNGPAATQLSNSTIKIDWFGYGHPNFSVEPGMQWVAFRTSVNIWHEPSVFVKCDDGEGSYGLLNFQVSTFPSHRLWINGVQVDEKFQGSFSDLWTASAFDPTFVA